MEFMFDTANMALLKKYAEIYPYTGVTSNPSIIKKEGKIDFFAHFREVRALIGKDRQLHLQAVGADSATMIAEAKRLREEIGDVIVKIPVTSEGIKAISALKKERYPVTATAIYNELQGYLAIAAGADYLAPYYNRIEAMGGNPVAVIEALKNVIVRQNQTSVIIAASFHEPVQMIRAIAAGADCVTMSPVMLDKIDSDVMKTTMENFCKDWAESQGCKNLLEL